MPVPRQEGPTCCQNLDRRVSAWLEWPLWVMLYSKPSFYTIARWSRRRTPAGGGAFFAASKV